MMDFAETLLFFSLLAGVFLGLVVRAIYLHRVSMHAQMFGELYIPTALFVLYVVAGFVVFLSDDSLYQLATGVPFQTLDLLLGAVYMVTVGIAYFVGFRMVADRAALRNRAVTTPSPDLERAVFIVFLVVLVADLLIRAKLMMDGQYFSWMRSFVVNNEEEAVGALAMLQYGFSPLLAVLSVYFGRRNKKWIIYFALLMLLVVLEGKRLKVLLTSATAILIFIYLYRDRLELGRLLKFFLIGVVFVSFSFLVIHDVREQFRADMRYAIQHPVTFLTDAMAKAVPEVLTLGRESDRGVDLKGAGVLTRGTAWATAFASQVYRLRTGSSYLPKHNFFVELALVVPSAVWPGKKPTIKPGENIGKHFGFAPSGGVVISYDPATTVFVSVFLYFGLLGALLFGLLSGALIGLVYRFLVVRYWEVGAIVFVGLIFYYSFDSNSFAAFFTGLRNAVLLLALLVFARVWVAGRATGAVETNLRSY